MMQPGRLLRSLLGATLFLALAPACATAAPKGKAAAALPSFEPDANLPRAEVPDAFKWNLAPLFADDEAFTRALAEAPAGRAKVTTFKGRLSEPKALAEAMRTYFEARNAANRLTLYASLRQDSHTGDSALQAHTTRALAAMSDFMAETTFVRQELLSLDDAALEKAYAAEPALAEYRPYIENVRRRRERVLTSEAERILSLVGDNLWAEIDLNELPSGFERSFRSLLGDIPLPQITDEDGKAVQLTLSNFPKYRASSDRRVRRDAVEALFGTLRQYQNAFGAVYSGQVHTDVTFARARGYDTALEAYLDKDDVDPAIYHSLISSLRENVAPLHRYVALRKKVMGLDEIRLFDMYTPLVESVDMKIPYAEAMQILPTALAPLGKDYVTVLRTGLDPKNGWIDVYPHADKDSGAFCASTYGLHPFVKMNYMNDYDGLSTLAHEYGHALHSHLSMSHQPDATWSYTTIVAETASTLNEKLLVDHLLKKAKTKEEKLYLLGEIVESIRTTIYRQTLFAEFELRVHTAAEQGTPLTADFLNATYADLVRHYYGPDFVMGEDDALEWAYIPHFYYKYYVYSYAVGLSSGIALADKIQAEGPKARDAYLAMLKGGSSRPPIELFRTAGVDLTKPEVFEAAARLMDTSLAEMERLLAVE